MVVVGALERGKAQVQAVAVVFYFISMKQQVRKKGTRSLVLSYVVKEEDEDSLSPFLSVHFNCTHVLTFTL